MMARAGVGALGAVLLAVLVFVAISSWSRQPAAAAKPSTQPINFPHKAHIRVGLKCQGCHGPVETMTTYAAETGPKLSVDLLNLVGFRPAPSPLSMGWCVECHRQQNQTEGRHAPLECVTCHH